LKPRAFKQGAEFTSWLRAPAAERFLKDLDGQVSEALENLLGASSLSSDPGVQGRYQNWKTLADMAAFMKNSRKESRTEEDE
jgi:hypothetical protein